MKSFYVSYGMDVGCRCLQMFVHDDGSSFVDFDVGSFFAILVNQLIINTLSLFPRHKGERERVVVL